MRIFVHDYAGHPFQVQLSRRLAQRGHHVIHAYCASTHTPQGSFEKRPDDPQEFDSLGIDLGATIPKAMLCATIPKAGYVRRFQMEAAYGRMLLDACDRFRPEVVISGNTPSIPQQRLSRHCKRLNIRHVFWVQDIYGLAAYKLLKKKLPGIGHLVGRYFIRLDRTSARLSDALVVISEDFVPIFRRWGVDEARIHVIHNWAVLEELPQRPRDNEWSRLHSLRPGLRFVYSGTLSIKHNPTFLLKLAKMLDERGEGELVVISEGIGVEWLERKVQATGVRSLRFLPFQPFDVMADALASADVLVAMLESDAGVFCVPSKVLSYMCAGRAILAAMPADNLAARLVVEHGAGIVVAPDDVDAFCQAAVELTVSESRREACGVAARRYAETNFDIDKITARFENALGAAS